MCRLLAGRITARPFRTEVDSPPVPYPPDHRPEGRTRDLGLGTRDLGLGTGTDWDRFAKPERSSPLTGSPVNWRATGAPQALPRVSAVTERKEVMRKIPVQADRRDSSVRGVRSRAAGCA
jgi:hypothetical protein